MDSRPACQQRVQQLDSHSTALQFCILLVRCWDLSLGDHRLKEGKITQTKVNVSTFLSILLCLKFLLVC